MTYTELKSAIFSYLGHYPDPDPVFEAMIGTLIEQAEARIYTTVRHPQMVERVYILDTSQGGDDSAPFLVPSDLLEPASLVGQDGTWESVTQDDLLDAQRCYTDATARPKVWAIFGQEMVFSVDPDDTLVLTYYQRPVALKDGGTQPLFNLFPHLFVAGGCAEAARFLREPDNIWQRYEQDFQFRLAEVVKAAWSATVPRRQPLKSRRGYY
jgi:hypothetical protein